jgi:ComF family protein
MDLQCYPLTTEQSVLQLGSLHCACDATFMAVGFEYEEDGVLERCIRTMKYRQLHSVGIWLGKMLGERLRGTPVLDDEPVLLPVPLHPVKQIERGYNQAEMLCRGIAEECALQLVPRLLQRSRYTRSQSASKLDRDERQTNMLNAFRVREDVLKEVKGRPILLVDDLITTGATMSECIAALNEHGAMDVRLLALARPPRH